MNRKTHLEGLRGLASLIVVFNHMAVAFYPALYNGNINQIHTRNSLEIFISKNPLNIIFNGNTAVCIFFILSGYVLTNKFFKTQDNNIIISSALKRYIRLAIPIFVSILFVFILMKLNMFYNITAAELSKSDFWLGQFWKFNPSVWDMIYNSFYKVMLIGDSSFNTVLWTMNTELLGSFLVFITALFIYRIKRRYVLYIPLLYIFFNTYYFAFLLGLILSDLDTNNKFLNYINKWYLNILIVICGLFLASYPTGINTKDTIYNFITYSFCNSYMLNHIIGSFMIMISIINSRFLQTLFSNKIFVFLGKISFPMYLLHVIAIGSIGCFVFINLIKSYSYFISVLFSCLATFVVTILLSLLFDKFVDKKAIKLADYFYKKII